MCDLGFEQEEEGKAYCLPCTPGKFGEVKDEIHICTKCGVDTYTNVSEQTACLNCANGRSSGAGAVSCSLCRAGQHVDGDGCTKCTKGHFQPAREAATCLICPRGRTSPVEAAVCSSCTTGRMKIGNNVNNYTCNDCKKGTVAQAGEICTNCTAGFYQPDTGQGTCRPCESGTWSDTVGSSSSLDCKKCDEGTYSSAVSATSPTTCTACAPGSKSDILGAKNNSVCEPCRRGTVSESGAVVCTSCLRGQFTLKLGESSCTKCIVGRYGSHRKSTEDSNIPCTLCPVGWKRADEDKNLTTCIQCMIGETTTIYGSTACSFCGIGQYGSMPGNCSQCLDGQYTSTQKSITCLECKDGRIPNAQKTGCEAPTHRVAKDCDYTMQYLNNTMDQKDKWECEICPVGAYCDGDIAWNEVKALQGYWRVPWSKNQSIFKRCPYEADCLGADRKSNTTKINVTEGCLPGTSGPLCSICIEGYNRDGGTCNICNNNSVPLRIGILVGVLIILVVIIIQCRKHVNKKWQMYRPLWRDFLRVISINITFAQINSSLPTVLDINWPPEWHRFVQNFAFVNIDVMSLIGISCIGDFNYYISFAVMVCLPISILVFALVNYHCAKLSMARRLRTLKETDKKNMEEEAFHSLFHLADADNSGEVDSAELAGILNALSWNVTVSSAHALVEKIAITTNAHGLFLLNEKQFIEAMISGKMKELLDEMEDSNAICSRKSSTKRMSLIASRLVKKKSVLGSRDQLIKWTLQKNIVANSLSGATQLLMLAHTPVSRKVFQYFDCNDLAGKPLLRADYDIECWTVGHTSFIPAVLIVLIGYVIALPGVISFYLWYNRKELYSTKISQTIGWLYDPFVRGAEFWQVHDVMMKMILTGMLIYVPSTSRAGIAVLVCIIAIANLNLFEPHKNKILFWLTQISFITTSSKYVMALLLSADLTAASKSEQSTISVLLITLDVFFLVSSVLAILIAVWVLRVRIKEIRKQAKIKESEADDENDHPGDPVDPVDPGDGNDNDNADTSIIIDQPDLSNDFSTFASRTQIQPVTPGRSGIARVRSARSQIVADIHEEHRKSQINLDVNIQMRARKQKRKTQLRLKARAKLKKQKVLANIEAFATLNEDEIEAMLDVMTRELYTMGQTLCKQGDVADKFYVVMKGECTAYGAKNGEEIRKLGSIIQYHFFGEASLLSEPGVDQYRNATVEVESDLVTLMVLTKTSFWKLIEDGELNRDILDGVKKVDLARQEQNMEKGEGEEKKD